jgi:hypothetical protein
MNAPPKERRAVASAPIKTANNTASVAAHSPEVNEVDRAFSTLASRQNASPPVVSVRVASNAKTSCYGKVGPQ